MTFAVAGTVPIARLPGQLRDAAGELEALDPVAEDVAEAIKAKSSPPVDTGALAASVHVSAGVIGSELEYAAPVHWGWTRGAAEVSARPWLIEAGDASVDAAGDLLEQHVIKSLGRID